MAGRTNTALPFYCIKFYGNPLSPCFVSSMPYLLMPVKAFSLGFKWDAGALSDYAPGIYSVPQPRPFRYSVPQPPSLQGIPRDIIAAPSVPLPLPLTPLPGSVTHPQIRCT